MAPQQTYIYLNDWSGSLGSLCSLFSGGGGGGGGGPPPPKKPKKEPRPKGRKCNLCKGYGHIKKFCPFAPAPPPPATAPPPPAALPPPTALLPPTAPLPPVAPPSSAGQRSNVERLLAECEQRPAPKRRMSV
ncbi:hypothetical protein KC333_g5084 [Hortaea werneckii]|nr:hypothetical protein KC333_g5084 [Hortaea werneckii]KAI7313814.1 hypothetical protein KC326_g5345 [Hortaea werneckii]